jgi:hypothetical protein
MVLKSIGLCIIAASMVLASDDITEHRKQIAAWQEHREAGLRSPTGWLTLAGLFWLKPGQNTVGSGETSDFLLPKEAPTQLGVLTVKGQEVTFTNLAGAGVTVNNKPVAQQIVLAHDEEESKSDKVDAGPIQFYVIDRDNRLAVRVKNRNSEALKRFKGTEFFPINPEFRFEAKFVPQPTKIAVPNVLGKSEQQESPGYVEFNYKGQSLRLTPIYEGKTLFFLFKDPTNKKETYQAGRMLNTPLPENGKVILDFNRAYNPPCTFTPYATCPLPPKGNNLPIRIEAGELRYGSGHDF